MLFILQIWKQLCHQDQNAFITLLTQSTVSFIFWFLMKNKHPEYSGKSTTHLREDYILCITTFQKNEINRKSVFL